MNILKICYDYYYEYMCLNHDNHLAKDMEVAFLHLVSSSSEKSVSKQQATLLNFNDIRPTVVEWLKLALSSVYSLIERFGIQFFLQLSNTSPCVIANSQMFI